MPGGEEIRVYVIKVSNLRWVEGDLASRLPYIANMLSLSKCGPPWSD